MRSLNRLKRDNPGLMTEIHEACLNKQAFLFVEPDVGGWVLSPIVEGKTVGVLVYAAWSDRPGAFVRYLPEVERLARMIGGRWLKFYSKRKGFTRSAPKLGWEQVENDSDIEGAYCFLKRL